MYKIDWDDWFPYGQIDKSGDWWYTTPPGIESPYYTTLLDSYIKKKVFVCPSQATDKKWTGYLYNAFYLGGYDQPLAKLSRIHKPSATVAVIDGLGSHSWCYPPSMPENAYYAFSSIARWRHNDGMNVLFADGHVEWRKSDDPDLNNTDDHLWDLD